MTRILLYSDEPILAKGLESVLRQVENFELLPTCGTVAGLLEQIAHGSPDLVLMDLSIPGIDGWECTRRIKADEKTKATPVIALTAHAMRGDEERARAAGCDHYLAKPISPKKVVEEVRKILGMSSSP